MSMYPRKPARLSATLCLLPLLLGLAACGGQAAKEVAYGTLKLTNTYEKEVDQKIAAESGFYKEQLANLRTYLIGTNELQVEVEDEARRTAVNKDSIDQKNGDQAVDPEWDKSDENPTDKAIKSSWLWGYIRTTSDNSALRAANLILNRPNEQPYGVILDLVEDGLQTNQEALAEVRRKQAELTVAAAETLQPLEKQGQRLATLKKGLTDLATTSGNILNLDDLLALAGSVLPELDGESSPE